MGSKQSLLAKGVGAAVDPYRSSQLHRNTFASQTTQQQQQETYAPCASHSGSSSAYYRQPLSSSTYSSEIVTPGGSPGYFLSAPSTMAPSPPDQSATASGDASPGCGLSSILLSATTNAHASSNGSSGTLFGMVPGSARALARMIHFSNVGNGGLGRSESGVAESYTAEDGQANCRGLSGEGGVGTWMNSGGLGVPVSHTRHTDRPTVDENRVVTQETPNAGEIDGTITPGNDRGDGPSDVRQAYAGIAAADKALAGEGRTDQGDQSFVLSNEEAAAGGALAGTWYVGYSQGYQYYLHAESGHSQWDDPRCTNHATETPFAEAGTERPSEISLSEQERPVHEIPSVSPMGLVGVTVAVEIPRVKGTVVLEEKDEGGGASSSEEGTAAGRSVETDAGHECHDGESTSSSGGNIGYDSPERRVEGKAVCDRERTDGRTADDELCGESCEGICTNRSPHGNDEGDAYNGEPSDTGGEKRSQVDEFTAATGNENNAHELSIEEKRRGGLDPGSNEISHGRNTQPTHVARPTGGRERQADEPGLAGELSAGSDGKLDDGLAIGTGFGKNAKGRKYCGPREKEGERERCGEEQGKWWEDADDGKKTDADIVGACGGSVECGGGTREESKTDGR